ncbi:serine hydrolase domain-containing protein [Allomesorhizobium alhagi]|jgi:CubicO group peptidase (beta-lactamase class C family)|uniref:Beta-lactamase n=1 Tax=Mesorhizobium alhagi CCNWXJ12-2 TaxID=1107882 RepID=H0HPH8_9HYPH|nr:serine hydrolase [Mesorhizobium alhagi]EHK57350.1 beta-lactamase [Mesorhizobium alhagi CCNWXJ12-2]
MTRAAALFFVLLLILAPAASAQEGVPPDPPSLDSVLDRAEALEPLETVIVAQGGKILAERGYRGNSVETPTNIKSASKTVISALVGIAIDKGVLRGVDQKIAPILRSHLPEDPDPRIDEITISHLLSMQAGLGRTSGPNYGRWVQSRDWVRAALAMPFDDEPGGNMLYSTGSTHLLSAILTRASGRSTRELAREWLGPLENFSIGGWERDPQGYYLGGNQMAMSPRSLLAFGELYRNGGKTPEGQQLVSPGWIEASWRPRTNSRYSGDGYGYGWFLRTIGGRDVRYAWGYGGQMLYIVPDLGLTVVMTSAEDNPSARNGHRDDLHALLAEIIGAVEAGEQAGGAGAAKEG